MTAPPERMNPPKKSPVRVVSIRQYMTGNRTRARVLHEDLIPVEELPEHVSELRLATRRNPQRDPDNGEFYWVESVEAA